MHAQIQAMCLITSANTNYRFRYRPDIHTHICIYTHTYMDRQDCCRFGSVRIVMLFGLIRWGFWSWLCCSCVRSFVRFVRFGWSHPCRDADLIAHLRCRKLNLLVQINRESRVEWSGVEDREQVNRKSKSIRFVHTSQDMFCCCCCRQTCPCQLPLYLYLCARMCVCVCIYEVSLFLSYLRHICYKLTGKDSSTNRKHFVIYTNNAQPMHNGTCCSSNYLQLQLQMQFYLSLQLLLQLYLSLLLYLLLSVRACLYLDCAIKRLSETRRNPSLQRDPRVFPMLRLGVRSLSKICLMHRVQGRSIQHKHKMKSLAV